MPSSRHEQITSIIDVIVTLKPQSLLDIGVGFGKYGVLAREYLEMWDGRYIHKKSDWTRRIDGIEAYKDYLTPVHDYIYDHIYIGDAKEVVSKLDTHYDLVLMIDVLEHFEFTEGIRLINTLLTKSRGILICVPKVFTKQDAIFDNPYEIHRAQWDRSDFKKHWKCTFIGNDEKTICLLGEQVTARWKRAKVAKLKKRVIAYVPFLRTLKRTVKHRTQ